MPTDDRRDYLIVLAKTGRASEADLAELSAINAAAQAADAAAPQIIGEPLPGPDGKHRHGLVLPPMIAPTAAYGSPEHIAAWEQQSQTAMHNDLPSEDTSIPLEPERRPPPAAPPKPGTFKPLSGTTIEPTSASDPNLKPARRVNGGRFRR